MKISNFIKNSIFALLPISLGLGVLFGTQNEPAVPVDAYNYINLGTMDINYFVGDEFSSKGLKTEATFNNGTKKEVIPTSITGYEMDKPGTQNVKVSYVIEGVEVQTSFSIIVKAIELNSISLSGSYKTEYFKGEELDTNGLIVTAHYNNNTTKEVQPTNVNGYNKDAVGTQTITVSFENKTATYTVNVKAPTITKITLSGTYKTSFDYGSEFTSEGLIVTAHYDNGTTKVVTPTSISGYNATAVGSQKITVMYTENGVTYEANYSVVVNPKVDPGAQPDPKPDPKPDPAEQNKAVVIITATAGGVVAVGGAITGISIGIHKKKIKVKKGK